MPEQASLWPEAQCVGTETTAQPSPFSCLVCNPDSNSGNLCHLLKGSLPSTLHKVGVWCSRVPQSVGVQVPLWLPTPAFSQCRPGKQG